MPKAGDELWNPATRLRTVFRETSHETEGELLQVDWIGAPGWSTGPDHVHPEQEERFEVLSGRVGLRVNGSDGLYGPGQVLVAPAGSPHAAWTEGDEPAHLLVDFRPALRTEIAFETLAGLAQAGKTNAAGAPKNPLQLALTLRHFKREIHLAKPPLAVQRALLGPLAATASLLGLKPEHPYLPTDSIHTTKERT